MVALTKACGVSVLIVAGASTACAGTYETTVRHALASARRARSAVSSSHQGESGTEQPSPSTAANLPEYERLAVERNPGLQAAFERWQASVHRISRSRRLPEPTLSFGYFVRSVETRVGPQQARVGVQQRFPWPTRLTAGADAASAQARSMQRRFEARALSVTRRVATAYWNLWQIRTTRVIHRDHLAVVRGLSESVRARISTGAATLADLQQIDLAAARLEDNILGMDEAERGAQARLRAEIGVGPDFPVPTPDPPGAARMPRDSDESLSTMVRSHPAITSVEALADSSDAAARASGAARLPSLTLGADWIITGEATMPGVQNSGQDSIVVAAGLKLPLWQGSYSDEVEAAQADSRAHRAEQRSLLERAEARVSATLANLRDSVRRVELYRSTLVPQAETVHESVLGSYTVGRGTVAQTLLSQRDLLELRIELEQARADHARTWATLEELVGQALPPAGGAAGASGAGEGS